MQVPVEACLPALGTTDGWHRLCPMWASLTQLRPFLEVRLGLRGDSPTAQPLGPDSLLMNGAPGRHFSLQTRAERPHSVPQGGRLAVHHWATSHARPTLPSPATLGDLVTGAQEPPAAPATGLNSRLWGRGARLACLGPALQPPDSPQPSPSPSSCPLIPCPAHICNAAHCQISSPSRSEAATPSSRKPPW